MSITLPNNLSSHEIVVNRVWLQGLVLTGVFYGVVATLCFSCFHLLSVARQSSRREPSSSRRQNKWLQIYVIFLFVVSTVDIALKGMEMDNAYIYHSDYPRGPVAFIVENASTLKTVQAVNFVILQWASDGLLLWRCLSFFSEVTFLLGWTQIIASLFSLINVALSIIFIIIVASQQSFGQSRGSLTLTYGFYTLFLNAVMTLAIVIKLLLHRHAMVKLLGPKHGTFYLGVISILIESAAVIIVYVLFFLISVMLRSPLSGIGRQIGVMVQIIPPLMIIQRVAQGIDPVRQMRTSGITVRSLSAIKFVTKKSEEAHDEVLIDSIIPVRNNSV